MRFLFCFLIFLNLSCQNNARFAKNKDSKKSVSPKSSQEIKNINNKKINKRNDKDHNSCSDEINSSLDKSETMLKKVQAELNTLEEKNFKFSQITKEQSYSSYYKKLLAKIQSKDELKELESLKENIILNYKSLKSSFTSHRVQCENILDIASYENIFEKCTTQHREELKNAFYSACDLSKEIEKFNQNVANSQKLLDETPLSMLPSFFRDQFDFIFEENNIIFDKKEKKNATEEFKLIYQIPACKDLQSQIIQSKEIQFSINENAKKLNSIIKKLRHVEKGTNINQDKVSFENYQVYLNSLRVSLIEKCNTIDDLNQNEVTSECFSTKGKDEYLKVYSKTCDSESEFNKSVRSLVSHKLKTQYYTRTTVNQKSHVSKYDKCDHINKHKYNLIYDAHIELNSILKKAQEMKNVDSEYISTVNQYQSKYNYIKSECLYIEQADESCKRQDHQRFCDLSEHQKIFKTRVLTPKFKNEFNPNHETYISEIEKLQNLTDRFKTDLALAKDIFESTDQSDFKFAKETYSKFQEKSGDLIESNLKTCETNQYRNELFKIKHKLSSTPFDQLCKYLYEDKNFLSIRNNLQAIQLKLEHNQ